MPRARSTRIELPAGANEAAADAPLSDSDWKCCVEGKVTVGPPVMLTVSHPPKVSYEACSRFECVIDALPNVTPEAAKVAVSSALDPTTESESVPPLPPSKFRPAAGRGLPVEKFTVSESLPAPPEKAIEPGAARMTRYFGCASARA